MFIVFSFTCNPLTGVNVTHGAGTLVGRQEMERKVMNIFLLKAIKFITVMSVM